MIHSVKGQEWKSVFVLNVVDGCIPSDLGTRTTEELEEERRLLYVAMTRAKDDLHLMVPQRFFVHGQSSQEDRRLYAARTRFKPGARSADCIISVSGSELRQHRWRVRRETLLCPAHKPFVREPFVCTAELPWRPFVQPAIIRAAQPPSLQCRSQRSCRDGHNSSGQRTSLLAPS